MQKNYLLFLFFILFSFTSCRDSTEEPINAPPVIQSISNKEVNEGETVSIQVDALDNESTKLNYLWKQESGIAVDLETNDKSEIVFMAPNVRLVDINSSLVFSVEVSDEGGAKSTEEVTISVLALAVPPSIESLNYSFGLFSNQTTTIDCSVIDPDGEVIEVKLSQVAGSAIFFISENNCSFIIKAPSVSSVEDITLQLSVKDNDDLVVEDTFQFMLSPTQRLNDTGVITFIDYALENSGNDTANLDCNLETDSEGDPILYGQDAHYGRDARQQSQLESVQTTPQNIEKTNYSYKVQLNNIEALNGFSYTKIASDGSVLADEASSWSCIKDNVTGLLWEIKTNDGLLHDRDNTYTWYHPDNTENAGVEDGGVCVSDFCDTYHYVIDVNEEGYCGVNSWRLPTPIELFSISDFSKENPTMDTSYFLNNLGRTLFWTSVPVVATEFFYGFSKGYASGAGIITNTPQSSAPCVRIVVTPKI